MTLEELIKIAEAWNNLGWATQNQAKAVIVDGADYNEQNPNALRDVVEWLRDVSGLEGKASMEAEEWAETLEAHLDGCFHEPENLEIVRGDIFAITLGYGWRSKLIAWVKKWNGDVLHVDGQHPTDVIVHCWLPFDSESQVQDVLYKELGANWSHVEQTG